MANDQMTPGIVAARLPENQLAANFADLHEPLDVHGASVAADRCYFCHDAPCMDACPTSIDIPLFIRQIQTGTPLAAARTIFDQNIMGGMCARVCPTETLCEEVCVRQTAEGKPVVIGQLQRFATDAAMAAGGQPYARAPDTGKKIAVVGAGPAGLACAHRLAMKGHAVSVYDGRGKSGGLNEYGIASYKSVDGFAQAEVDWLLEIGGITVHHGLMLGSDLSLADMQKDHDAVFLAVGLGGVNSLRCDGEDMKNITDAVDFIAELRQAIDLGKLKIGRNIVVIGGGMTAVDAAVQSKLLGAENVTMVYRRGAEAMAASMFEQELATAKGVRIIFSAMPRAVHGKGAVQEVEFEYTVTENGNLTGTGETFRLAADQVFKAIGQTLDGAPEGVKTEHGKVKVGETGRTSVDGIWAGGDCASGGDDLTVTAVAEGRDAAEDIHGWLAGKP